VKSSPPSGRGGQKFLERCVPKVAQLRARFPEKDIQVDGGVGPKTVDLCAHAGKYFAFVLCNLDEPFLGSNVIVAGTAIFGAAEPDRAISVLKATVDAAHANMAAR
jgi:ribulose-phosphate 3-epimerase